VSTSKTLYIINCQSSGALWRLILFYWAFKHALLLRVLLCISWAFLVHNCISVSVDDCLQLWTSEGKDDDAEAAPGN